MEHRRRKDNEHVDLLMAFSAGKLDPEKNVEFQRHLEGCPECAESLEAQLVVWKALDAWKAPEVSAGFNRALYAKIESAGAAPWYDRWSALL